MYSNCQSCGNTVFSINDYGTDGDGRRNRDFCSNCYKGGKFYRQDWRGFEDGPYPTHALTSDSPPMSPYYTGMYMHHPNGYMGWF
jgi:hypothetical protein